jgi:hypothetical protein
MGFRGKASLNDHIGRAETEQVTARDSPIGSRSRSSSTAASVRKVVASTCCTSAPATSYFDDVKPLRADRRRRGCADRRGAGPRSEEILLEASLSAACVNCHMVGGKGSAIGPALDGIATRATPAYIHDSLVEPNKVFAKGYREAGRVPDAPDGSDPQAAGARADVKAYLQTLK